MQWEYKIYTGGQAHVGYSDAEALKHAGLDGWELVAVISYGPTHLPSDPVFYFKRPVATEVVARCYLCNGTGWVPEMEPHMGLCREVPGVSRPCPRGCPPR